MINMRYLTSFYIIFSIVFISIIEDVHSGEPEDNDPFYVVANDSIVAKDVLFHLNTRDNPNQHETLIQNDIDSLKKSHFDKRKPIKILVHGWAGHSGSPMNIYITDAFLKTYDVNVISVDWHVDADGPYERSVWTAPAVGKKISSFIDWLIDNDVPIDNFHIIGYSLGSHVTGSAARHVKNGKLPYVTGLDPAKKYWKHSPERLDKNDGKYVEIIHTNTRFYGLSIDIGHNDFYPNGGYLQPGAETDPASHARAYEYFSESIRKGGFLANQCLDIQEITQNKCSNLTQLNMGGLNSKKPTGVFQLETYSQSPFSKT